MEKIAEGDHFRYLVGRLAKAAEYDLLETAQITHSVCRGNHLFHRRIAVSQPQIIAVVAGTLVANAEIAGVRAFVGEIDVQIAVQGIHVGILAVFLSLILLFLLIALLLVSVLIVLLLGLRLFGLLLLGLRLLLLPVLLRLRVFVLLIFLLIPLRLIAVLGILGLLRSLRGLLGLLDAVFGALIVALIAFSASMTTAFSAAVRATLLRVRLFVFVLDFVHDISSI